MFAFRKLVLAAVVGLAVSFYPLLGRGPARPAGGGEPVRAGSTAPFNVIYLFYSALASNDWPTAEKLTSRALWSYLRESGFIDSWRQRRQKDPTVAFSLFLVKASTVEEKDGRAWAFGEAQWTGGRGRPPNSLQTIFLQRAGGMWVITRIDSRSAVEVTTEFYQAVATGDWLTMRRLVTPDYWGYLVSTGVISAWQQDWARTAPEVYLVLHVRDLQQGGHRAWVSADVLWRPLSFYERETPVVVELVKDGQEWLISRIHGHWEVGK